MKSAEFYAQTAVAQAKAAVKFRNKYLTALALNTVYTAYIYGIITGGEWQGASKMIKHYAARNHVEYICWRCLYDAGIAQQVFWRMGHL